MFEAKIRYEKIAENGMNKKVTELYIVSAYSFTEAETRIIQEVTPYISGDFAVSGIKPVKYNEIFSAEDGSDCWFKCKIYFITLDEKSGSEKKTAANILVQALDLRDAVKKLDEGMKGTMADYEIASISETDIIDVYNESINIKNTVLLDGEVGKFLDHFPEGARTETKIAGKTYIIDKTNSETIVRPKD